MASAPPARSSSCCSVNARFATTRWYSSCTDRSRVTDGARARAQRHEDFRVRFSSIIGSPVPVPRVSLLRQWSLASPVLDGAPIRRSSRLFHSPSFSPSLPRSFLFLVRRLVSRSLAIARVSRIADAPRFRRRRAAHDPRRIYACFLPAVSAPLFLPP